MLHRGEVCYSGESKRHITFAFQQKDDKKYWDQNELKKQDTNKRNLRQKMQ